MRPSAPFLVYIKHKIARSQGELKRMILPKVSVALIQHEAKQQKNAHLKWYHNQVDLLLTSCILFVTKTRDPFLITGK